MLEKNDNVGKGPCKRHCDVDIKALNMWRVAKKGITTGTTSGMLYDEFESLFESEEVEVLAVLEAIDPLMSGTFQAIQVRQEEHSEANMNMAHREYDG